MSSITISVAEARRLAIQAQCLAGPRSRGVLETVRETGPLQLDPTTAVARSEQLVLWSRLGPYEPAELDRLLWKERALLQWRAFVYPTDDWPILAAAMRRFPETNYARGRQIREWLEENAAFRRYVLAELRRRGPLLQRELSDRSASSWRSRGWTADRNVSQMLEFLWAQGKVLVAGRQGQERLWDLAERVVPPRPALSARDAARIEVERRVRALGLVTRTGLKRTAAIWLLPLDDALVRLVREGAFVPLEVEGVRGTWYAHPDALGRDSFQGRTTLLSPFDPLIYDRTRTEELFGFRFRLEIYVPRARREFGFFVLPILHGDRLIGRIDPLFDRKSGVLQVNAVYAEPDAQREAWPEVKTAIDDLASWVGAERVELPRLPGIWR